MDYTIIKIKTNFTDLHGWIALGTNNQPIGHVFMQVEKNDKVKFMDAWVHEDYRRQGIFTDLWNTRWEYAKEKYEGNLVYAWCLPDSVNLYRRRGFNEGAPAVYMEKIVE